MTDDLRGRLEALEAKLAAVDSLENQLKSRVSHAMLDATWTVRKQMLTFIVLGIVVIVGSAAFSVLSFLRSRPSHVQENVRARRFELLDKEGKARIVLEEDAKEGAGLVLVDREGRRRGRLRVSESGELKLLFGGTEGRDQLVLHLNDVGEPNINLCDRNGRPRIGMIVEQKNADKSYLLQSDNKGTLIWRAPP